MASRDSILAQIDEINAKISTNTKEIQRLEAAANEWHADAANDICNQILRRKRRECETERSRKFGKAKAIRDTAASLRQENKKLQEQINTLNASIEAINTASINLSKDGKDLESAIIKAQGEADAKEKEAEGEAQSKIIEAAARAKAIEEDSKADSEIKKKKGMLFLIIGVAAAGIILFFLIKKMKK